MDIKEALGQLDTMEDEHWTSDGMPRTDVVSSIMEAKVTRKDITDAAPKFTRENTDLSGVEETSPEEGSEPVDTSVLSEFVQMEPMLQEEFAEKVLKKIDPRLLPQVDAMLAEQMIALEAKESELAELKRRVKMSRALTTTWIKALIPDMSNQEAIQAYIRSSHQNRAEKAQKIQQVLGGLKPADIAKLDPRAAIDKAFARKTGRSGQRPAR